MSKKDDFIFVPVDPPSNTVGRKDDSGKNRLTLIPQDALWEVGKVYTMGAQKYEPYNWQKGIEYSRVADALERHLNRWLMGERDDTEDGQHHLSSVAWCALTLLHYDLNSERFAGFDDRRKGLWKEVWKT